MKEIDSISPWEMLFRGALGVIAGYIAGSIFVMIFLKIAWLLLGS